MSTLARISGEVNQDNTFAALMGDYQTPAYAATIAILTKKTSATTIVQPATLTGAVTFTVNVGDDTADDIAPYIGDEILFLLTAASTEVATFSTGFAPAGTLSVTGTKYASIKFIFSGTVWQEVHRTETAVNLATETTRAETAEASITSSIQNSFTISYPANFVDSLHYVNTALNGVTYQVVALNNTTNNSPRYPTSFLTQGGTSPAITILSTGGFTLSAGYSAKAGDQFLIMTQTNYAQTVGNALLSKTGFGATGNARYTTDCTVTASSTTLTSPTMAFTSADVGKTVGIAYAGANNGTLTNQATFVTTVASVTNSTTIVLTAAPTNSITAPRTITDAAMTAGSNVLTSATANFTQADVGKQLSIPGAGYTQTHAGTTTSPQTEWIVSLTNSTTVVCNRQAVNTVSAQTVAIPGAWVEIGTDNTQALQSMITAAISQKRQCILEAGRYLTTAALTMSSGNFDMVGFGPGNSIISPVGVNFSAISKTATTVNQMTDVYLKDFEIDCMGVTVSTYNTAYKGIYFTDYQRAEFRNLYIHNACGTGLGCDYPVYTLIDHCVCQHNGRQTMEFGSASGGANIGIGSGVFTEESITIQNCFTTDGLRGIFVENQGTANLSTGVNMSNNYEAWCSYGISDDGDAGAIITGNHCSNNSFAGIAFIAGGGMYSQDEFVANNVLRDNTEGILVNYKNGSATIKNNDISNLTVAGNTALGGIVVYPISGGTPTLLDIEDNYIHNVQGSGILLQTGTYNDVRFWNNNVLNIGYSTSSLLPVFNITSATINNLSIRRNQGYDERTTGNQFTSYGLFLSGTVTRFLYDGNDFTGYVTAQQNTSGATITTPVTNTNP
jgi:hypothetical protein